MIISDFKYKPRFISKLTKVDFEECGFNFERFYSELLSVKQPQVVPFPENWLLNANFVPIDRQNYDLGIFRFSLRDENGDWRGLQDVNIRLRFPLFEKVKRQFNKIDRDAERIFASTAVPNSIETVGYAFGNFHLNVQIENLFCQETILSFNFDEEGNYLPVFFGNRDYISNGCMYSFESFTYPEGLDPYNPTDIDKMLIPELSVPALGSFVFWLDRYHIAVIRDVKKAGASNMESGNIGRIANVLTSSGYKELMGNKAYEIPSDDIFAAYQKEKLAGLYNKPSDVYRGRRSPEYWRSGDDILYSIDGLFSISAVNHRKNELMDISTFRTTLNPIYRKTLELIEIVNSNTEHFYKATIFPDTMKKIADIVAPLVVKTSQIVRSCKSFAMEEI